MKKFASRPFLIDASVFPLQSSPLATKSLQRNSCVFSTLARIETQVGWSELHLLGFHIISRVTSQRPGLHDSCMPTFQLLTHSSPHPSFPKAPPNLYQALSRPTFPGIIVPAILPLHPARLTLGCTPDRKYPDAREHVYHDLTALRSSIKNRECNMRAYILRTRVFDYGYSAHQSRFPIIWES